jgi:hypothetical protein
MNINVQHAIYALSVEHTPRSRHDEGHTEHKRCERAD